MKAIWNGQTIAESEKTIVLEGNHYFPRAALKSEFFRDSEETSVCFWKGQASYYDIVVDGKTLGGGAWYYPEPSAKARRIAGHVAFWRGVEVSE